MDWLTVVVERLNLSQPGSLVGNYIQDIISWLCILFGISLIFFAKKHMNFFLVLTGLLIGSWIGITIKVIFSHNIHAVFYFVLTSLLCAFLMVAFKRVIGIIVGGFLAVVFLYFVYPALLQYSSVKQLSYTIAMIFGMLMGAIAPTFCIACMFALIGSAFISHGVTHIMITYFKEYIPVSKETLANLIIFVPTFVGGLAFQLVKSKPEVEGEKAKGKPTAKEA